jgi:hypothetical protein
LKKKQLTNLSKKSKRFRNPKTKLKEVGKSDKSREKKRFGGGGNSIKTNSIIKAKKKRIYWELIFSHTCSFCYNYNII